VGTLILSNVARSFGDVVAVRDVSFTVPAGIAYGLLGPNGAGKTTTMRMILGILVPDGGTVTWDGAPVDYDVRRRFGYLPEERGLYGKLKVREQIAYFGRLHGVAAAEAAKRAAAWIERLGLDAYADRPCAELSKGNQQKVQIACAALHDPELLVLDEPFSGLDPLVRDELIQGLLDRIGETTLFLSSHDLAEIESFASHVGYLEQGTLLFSEEMTTLSGRFRRVQFLVDPANALPSELPDMWLEVERSGSLVSFTHSAFRGDAQATAQVAGLFPSATNIECVPVSLRSIFLANARTRRNLRAKSDFGATV
jgi:ABC-2 type transport system ATP-binding protein